MDSKHQENLERILNLVNFQVGIRQFHTIF